MPGRRVRLGTVVDLLLDLAQQVVPQLVEGVRAVAVRRPRPHPRPQLPQVAVDDLLRAGGRHAPASLTVAAGARAAPIVATKSCHTPRSSLSARLPCSVSWYSRRRRPGPVVQVPVIRPA